MLVIDSQKPSVNILNTFHSYEIAGGLLNLGFSGVVSHYEYDAFGRKVLTSGSGGNRFQFSTKYYDKELGLCYYGFRYYDAGLGRWLNRDPIGEDGGLSLYGMVTNDSVNRWDYLGLLYVESDSGWGSIISDTSGGVACDASAPSSKTLTYEREVEFLGFASALSGIMGETPANAEGGELTEAALKMFSKLARKRVSFVLSAYHNAAGYRATYKATKKEVYKCSCSWFGLGSWEWRYEKTEPIEVSILSNWNFDGDLTPNVMGSSAHVQDTDSFHPEAMLYFDD